MQRIKARLSVVTSLSATFLLTMSGGAHAQLRRPSGQICGDYLGVIQCTFVDAPNPKKPSTTKGMKAVATPPHIPIDATVTVVAGKAPGGKGFTRGEVVRIFEFWQGKATELTGAKFAGGNGSVTFTREYLLLAGLTKPGPRTLCARGEKSMRMACTTVMVGDETASSSTSPTSAPASTSGPQSATSTKGMKSMGSTSKVRPGQKVRVTSGKSAGGKAFTPGEKIRYYDFVDGQRNLISSGKASSNGTATVSTSWDAASSTDSTHEICAYGVSSHRMACYEVLTEGYPASVTTAPITVTSTAPLTIMSTAPLTVITAAPTTVGPATIPTTTVVPTTTTTIPSTTTTLGIIPWKPPTVG